jgi:hypothetical protein
MTDNTKFLEPLPPASAFTSDLAEKGISEKDYKFVNKLWKSFKMQTLGDLHNVYVRSDVALLADIILNIRNLLFDNKDYGLDLGQYLTLPMISLDAMLKLTGVEIELITDPTMHCWVESAIRGGFCGVQSLRHCKANNAYLPDHDPKKPTTFISYIDANNEYGRAMSWPLPIGGYEWADNPDAAYAHALTLDDDSEVGYMLEVDADYPPELHDYFNEFPPLPVKRVIDGEELSESYQQGLAGSSTGKVGKLVCDLHEKKNYILHHKTLQLYVKLGVEIKAVHRVLKFKQSNFLAKYIHVNTMNRNAALNELFKDFWKLFSNAGMNIHPTHLEGTLITLFFLSLVFGKMIEQVRDRRRVNIVLDEDSSNRLTRKPTCQRVVIIDENCTLHVMKKLRVHLDKPILTGRPRLFTQLSK